MKKEIIHINGINLEITHENGNNIQIIQGDFCDFERDVIDCIIELIECDNSDAQGIAEIHSDVLINSYKLNKTAEETALLIDDASFIKPKTLAQAIENITRLNDYYVLPGMLHDDNYIRCINRNLCAIAQSDRPEVSNLCLDYNL